LVDTSLCQESNLITKLYSDNPTRLYTTLSKLIIKLFQVNNSSNLNNNFNSVSQTWSET